MQTRSQRLLCATVIMVVLFAVPLPWVDHGPSLCVIKAMTGHECPGCGMTRALMHALHGDPAGACVYNWRWVLVAPLLLAGMLRWIMRPPRHPSASLPVVPSIPIE